MSDETCCHCGQLVQVSEEISLKCDFLHVHNPGARADKPLGTEF